MDKVWNEIDRRGYTRVSVKDTQLWIKKKQDEALHFSEMGILKDIGIGGMSFYLSPEDLLVNEEIDIRVKLNRLGSIELKGVIVHIHETKCGKEKMWVYGVEFADLAQEQRNKIKDYVLEQLSLNKFFSEAKKTAN